MCPDSGSYRRVRSDVQLVAAVVSGTSEGVFPAGVFVSHPRNTLYHNLIMPFRHTVTVPVRHGTGAVISNLIEYSALSDGNLGADGHFS